MTDGNRPDRNFAPSHSFPPCMCCVFIFCFSSLISARIQLACPGYHTKDTNIYLLPPLAAAALPTLSFLHGLPAALLFSCCSQVAICYVFTAVERKKNNNTNIYTYRSINAATCPTRCGRASTHTHHPDSCSPRSFRVERDRETSNRFAAPLSTLHFCTCTLVHLLQVLCCES